MGTTLSKFHCCKFRKKIAAVSITDADRIYLRVPPRSPEPISGEVVRMLAAKMEEEEPIPPAEHEMGDKRLSDLAERLFMQQQRKDTLPDVEMGNEKPIELESEQSRRIMHKHRASVAGAPRYQTHRGSIAVIPTVDTASAGSLSTKPEIPFVQSSSKMTDASKSQLDAESSILFSDKDASLEPTLAKIESMDTRRYLPLVTRSFASEPELDQVPEISFQRLYVSGESGDLLLEELRNVAVSLIHALRVRQFYMRQSRQSFPLKVARALARATRKPCKQPVYPTFVDPMEKPYLPNDEKSCVIKMEGGVMKIVDLDLKSEVALPEVNRNRFIMNRNLIYALVADGPLYVLNHLLKCSIFRKTFCYRRLFFLKKKFGLHCLLNEEKELEIMKNPERKCRRDFYNVRKVDTHIHAAACMSQKHLLGFMQEKMKIEPDRFVLEKNGKRMTLREVYQSLDIDPFCFNVDALDVHADRQTFHRFDRFNNLYSPMGASELREIFLKTSNDINGDYFAELIQEVERSLVQQKYHLVELRISIYGKNYSEWYELAKWFNSHKLGSTHIRWLIQVPRLYDVYKEKGVIKNFQEMLDNIFRPLFEATLSPNKHKDISLFLRHVTGFDSVDDESKPEPGFMKKSSPFPDQWDRDTNPSYTYYIFYMYANITRLNHMRQLKGLNTFVLRPHCGEAGSYDHLISGFMLAHNISHGLVLKTVPVLQYLYYLAQISICMSPLSNNHLFLEYNKSPFPEFFARGLKVNLSTDDPLQFHFTMEPLMEEYAVAAQVWKLSVCDMCEMAKTSVQASCFSHAEKKRWLGDHYRKEGSAGNDISRTNVPNVRVAFREETLLEELRLLSDGCNQANDVTERIVLETAAESARPSEENNYGFVAEPALQK